MRVSLRLDPSYMLPRIGLLFGEKRYGHFLFGFIQSGLTCAVAAAIASAPFLAQGVFVIQWLKSWLIDWGIMTPFVLLAAPMINRAVAALTRNS